MLTVQELLERARSNSGGISWYRLARDIGASDNSVTRWRKGEGAPNDEMSVRLADMAGMPAWSVLAAMHAIREPAGSPVRAAWEQAWQRLCIMLQPAMPTRRRTLRAAAL
jgi:hypothetical protein